VEWERGLIKSAESREPIAEMNPLALAFAPHGKRTTSVAPLSSPFLMALAFIHSAQRPNSLLKKE
jgi:hypothetical protein